MYSVHIDSKRLAASLSAYAEGIGVSVDEASKKICEKIIEKANENLDEMLFWEEGIYEAIKPRPEKRIKHSWVKKQTKKGHWVAWNTSPHAVWVEYGTGVYGAGRGPITPRGSHPMKFMLPDGTWISTYVVAGQPPKMFLSRAVQEVQNEILPIVSEQLFKKMIQSMK